MKEHSNHFNQERDYPQYVIHYLNIVENFINTYDQGNLPYTRLD